MNGGKGACPRDRARVLLFTPQTNAQKKVAPKKKGDQRSPCMRPVPAAVDDPGGANLRNPAADVAKVYGVSPLDNIHLVVAR